MLLLFRYGPAACINVILMFLFFLLLMKPNDFSYHKTKDGSLAELVRKRYQSFDSELGAQIEVKFCLPPPPPSPPSFFPVFQMSSLANAWLHSPPGW